MHSQNKDFRHAGVVEGDLLRHRGRLLCLRETGFAAGFHRADRPGRVADRRMGILPEQGARASRGLEKFVTFKAYEAGAANGHRNVIYVSDAIKPPLDPAAIQQLSAALFLSTLPMTPVMPFSFRTTLRPGRTGRFMIRSLSTIMEIYSCWGQSESPGPGAVGQGNESRRTGAWEALAGADIEWA